MFLKEENIKNMNECVYKVKGMHCASCEVLIEKTILDLYGVQAVDASTGKGEVTIEYENDVPTVKKLNHLFKKDNYLFLEKSVSEIAENSSLARGMLIAAIIILVFLGLNKMGFSNLINVSSTSTLPAFFIFGLLAGFSTCAALVGGIVLSMSKQWSELYSNAKGSFTPHVLFNFGRLISFTILGGVLGAVGGSLQLSLSFTSGLVLVVSFLMLGLGLQMLGVKSFSGFQFAAPKFITRYVADEKNFNGKYMPFLMGAATFLLPCGFTITAQGMALLSGSAVKGALIMVMFVLGTMPALLGIGLTSIKFSENHHFALQFSRVAGILVLFFAIFNINNQLNFLGLPSFNSFQNIISVQQPVDAALLKDLPPIVDGKQILKMNASSSGYDPANLKVRVGIPVRWEITDTGTSGCTNAVIARDFLSAPVNLTPGKTSIAEFTPQAIGSYRFSCWMGMVRGSIEVVN
jgi:sulfite exporter TauE/SafE/copper chaperone CopZ/plastocyanin